MAAAPRIILEDRRHAPVRKSFENRLAQFAESEGRTACRSLARTSSRRACARWAPFSATWRRLAIERKPNLEIGVDGNPEPGASVHAFPSCFARHVGGTRISITGNAGLRAPAPRPAQYGGRSRTVGGPTCASYQRQPGLIRGRRPEGPASTDGELRGGGIGPTLNGLEKP